MAKKKNKIQKLKNALKQEQNSIALILQLVSAYKETGDIKNAIKCLNQYNKVLPSYLSDIELAKIYIQQGQTKLAIQHYQATLNPLIDAQEFEKLSFVYNYLVELKQDTFYAMHYHWRSFKYMPDEEVLSKLNALVYGFCFCLNNGSFIVKDDNNILAYAKFEKKPKHGSLHIDNHALFWQHYIAALEKLHQDPTHIEFFIKTITEKEYLLVKKEDNLTLSTIANKWLYFLILFFRKTHWQFSISFFEVQAFLKKYNHLMTDEIKNELLEVKATFKSTTDLPIHQFAYHVIVFFVDAFLTATEKPLQTLIEYFYQLADDDPAVLYFSMPIWHKLFHIGYFNNQQQLLIELMIFCGKKFSEFTIPRSCQIFNCFYDVSSDRYWNQLVFEKIVVPSALSALKRHDFLYAAQVLTLTDLSYAQQPMIEPHRKACRDKYLDELLCQSLALSQKTQLNALNPQNIINNKIKIGFVVNFLVKDCSPIRLLLTAIKSIQKLSSKFEFALYSFQEADKITELFSAEGVNIVNLSITRGALVFDNYQDRLLALRETIWNTNTHMIAFIQCNPVFMTLASALKLAPIQVFWSVGGDHSFRIPTIQEYITMAGIRQTEKIIAGYPWRTFSGGESYDFNLVNNLSRQDINALRAKFDENAIILGSICRAAKLDDDNFISALATIMAEDENIIYLWFGVEESANVVEKMKKYHIYERCFFQGWVNSTLYAAILDIHLEPFDCAASSPIFESMVLGKPVVLFYSQAHPEAGLMSYILPALQYDDVKDCFFVDGQQLLLYTDSQEHYIQFAIELLRDKVFSQKVGLAGKNFIDNIFRQDKMGTYLIEHFLDMKDKYLHDA